MIESQPNSIDNQETITDSKGDISPKLSLEEVVSEIKSGIPLEVKNLNGDELEERRKELSELPYLSQTVFSELLYPEGEDLGVIMVDTKNIVGSISSAFENWSTEYDSRKGRIVNIAQQLINPTSESIDNVFHVKEPRLGIRLKQLPTPQGNLYFVIDGSHRVAGCKLAKVNKIPTSVEKIPEPKAISTRSNSLKSDWETRIKSGFIKGSVEAVITEEEGSKYLLKIESQILPWMFLPENQLLKLNKFYFEHFPEAKNLKSVLNDKSIPKDALTDGIALNYYLANRWDEYIQRRETSS